MASSNLDVDSAENLSRWRAIMAGSSSIKIDATSSYASSAPKAASSSWSERRLAEVSEPTASAQTELPVGSINSVEAGTKSGKRFCNDISPESRSRAASFNDYQFRTAVHNAMQASKVTTRASTSPASRTLAQSAYNSGTTESCRSTPNDIPPMVLGSGPTPTQSAAPTSPSPHPHPSPSISGLLAPLNSPQVHAASPQLAPGNTHDEDVGAALAWFVQNMEGGRPLSESMWAPKNEKYASSPLRRSGVSSNRVTHSEGLRPSSRDLTSVNVVHPNPAINATFSRMTFQAADSDCRISDNIIGERNIRLSMATPATSSGVRPLRSNDALSLASPRLPGHTQDAVSNIAQEGIIATDFAKEENVSSSTAKAAWAPPHLRGKDKAPPSSARPHDSPADGIKKSLKDDLVKAVEIANGVSPMTSQTTLGTQSTPETGTLVNGSTSAEIKTPPSLSEIGQNLLRTIVDLETNGHLNPEMIASLYVVHDTIKAQLSDTAEEPTDDYYLPAKAYKDPNCPMQKLLVPNTSTAMTEHQATNKASDERRLTIHTRVPDAAISESESNTPASGYSSTGLGSDDFRKILAAVSASTANSPIETANTASLEKLRSVPIGKASASPPGTSDIPNSSPSHSDKTGIPVAVVAPQEKIQAVLSIPAAAGKAANAAADAQGTEDRQEMTWFASWGKCVERDKPAAKVRTVLLTGLPYKATASLVASLVYGGTVECIQTRSSADGAITASVRFMDADACKRYHDDTSNGIVYKKDVQGRELVVFVDLAGDVDVVGGMLQQWIENGMTRCVRAVGVDEEWGMDGLRQFAEEKGRKLEGISDSINTGGARSVVFRFCKVEDAVQFKSAVVRNQDWEHCNVHFAVDPCATATGVHFHD